MYYYYVIFNLYYIWTISFAVSNSCFTQPTSPRVEATQLKLSVSPTKKRTARPNEIRWILHEYVWYSGYSLNQSNSRHDTIAVLGRPTSSRWSAFDMRQTRRARPVPASWPRGYLAATYLLYTLFAPDGINPRGWLRNPVVGLILWTLQPSRAPTPVVRLASAIYPRR